MGINEVSYRQTQAALRAMQAASSTADATLGAMFPLTMIPTGAISSDDAGDFGQAAGTAAATFRDYLAKNGVTAEQMSTFQDGLLRAMRTYTADNQAAVAQPDPGTAAGYYGRANAQFMAALIQAGEAAGIDPLLMTAAFDQAGQAIDNSPALTTLPAAEIDAMHAAMLAGARQGQLFAQMSRYAAAMPTVLASPDETQTFTSAMSALQDAMLAARQGFFQQAFADPTALPDPATLDQAQSTLEAAMQSAFDAFNTATTASTTQIDAMLGVIATGMGGTGGGMMGGGMLSGSTLAGMGFGMLPTTLDGTPQNWSTMMVAAGNLIPSVPDLAYTPDTADLAAQLPAAEVPAAPDWSQMPDGPYRSLLELQYDLMLVHLIDLRAVAGLTPPLTQDDLATVGAQDLANRQAIRQGVQGGSDAQLDALMAALSPPRML